MLDGGLEFGILTSRRPHCLWQTQSSERTGFSGTKAWSPEEKALRQDSRDADSEGMQGRLSGGTWDGDGGSRRRSWEFGSVDTRHERVMGLANGAFSMGLRRWRAGFGDFCGWVGGDVVVGGVWHSLKGFLVMDASEWGAEKGIAGIAVEALSDHLGLWTKGRMFDIEPLAFGGDSQSFGILQVEISLFGMEPLALGGNSAWATVEFFG